MTIKHDSVVCLVCGRIGHAFRIWLVLNCLVMGVNGSAFADEKNERNLNRVEVAELPVGEDILVEILSLANNDYVLEFVASQSDYQIGKDYLNLKLRSNYPGYLYLVAEGSSGQLYQLFPNTKETSHKLKAFESVSLPGPAWPMLAQGPPGENRFLAIVSAHSDLFGLLGEPAGPFKVFLNKPAVMNQLMSLAGECGVAENSETVADGGCLTGFGAKILSVNEVD